MLVVRVVIVVNAGDLVAHIKFTVLLMPNGSDKITSHPLQELQPTKSIEDNAEIKAWLAMGTKTKKKGGGKKKKGLSCKYKAVLHAETLISFYGLSSNW
jgi:hypothetical protein